MPRNRSYGIVVAVLVILVSCAPRDQAPPSAASVSPEQFRELSWLTGKWRGSGGAYPAFFEEYRQVDDSTIAMRAFSDSTFRVATDSSRIERRNGTVASRRGSETPSIAVTVSNSSIRFMKEGTTTGGYTFTRVSDNEWTATLHPAGANGAETVYVMKRVP